MERRASRARQNAMRSGLVVVGAIAFGYLSFKVGFKPYVDRAQAAMERTLPVDREAGQLEERFLPPSDATISLSQDEEEIGRWFWRHSMFDLIGSVSSSAEPNTWDQNPNLRLPLPAN